MSVLKFFALAAAFAAVTVPCAADTWYVSAENYGKEGLTGKTEALAWGTLQDAHDNAADGDTVLVLPGYYDKGESVDTRQSHPNRLTVTKKLFFRAQGGKGSAHIVGEIDPDTGSYGPGAVRGINVAAGGLGSEFHGFVIRDCASGDGGDEGNGYTTGMGGGVLLYGYYATVGKTAPQYQAYFVDCVFSNNFAKWGAAMRGGTAIRCLITDNAGLSFGQAVSSGALWNSVVRGTTALQSDRPTVGNGTIAVNTTFYDNGGYGSARTNEFYNCAFNMQGRSATVSTWGFSAFYGSYQDTYAEAGDRYVFMSPATGDFRPVAGRALDGSGVTSYLTDVLALPADTVMKDFNGNDLDLAAETCDAGAVQGTAVPDGGRMIFTPGDVFVDGVYNRGTTYSHVEHWPTQRRVVSNKENFLRWRTVLNSSHLCMHYPQQDGVCLLVPSANAADALTFNEVSAELVLWADPLADAAIADGSSEKPFRTLQAAMDCVTERGISPTIVYARAGEYDEGEAFAYGHTNRVVFPPNHAVLLKSVAGAESTVIRGRMDPDGAYPEDYRGCGPAAMRCVAVPKTTDGNSANHAIQGFTLADGCASVTNNSYKSTPESDRSGGLLAVADFQVHDCIFTNCNAVRCGASAGGAVIYRSRFDDCVSYGGVIREDILVACEVLPTCSLGTGPSGASRNAVCGSGTRGFFSTLPVSVYSPYGNNSAFYCGCIFDAASAYKGSYWATVFREVVWADDAAVGYAEAEAAFIDAEAGDLRLPFYSPALGAGVLPERGTDAWYDFGIAMARYSSGDIDGNALVIRGGEPMPGARHVYCGGVYTLDGHGALKLSGEVHEGGYTRIDSASDAAVAVNPDAARQPTGFSVNGITNFFAVADAEDCVISAEAIAAGVYLEPVFSDKWYVDAQKGNDSNPGYDPAWPKRTLASVLAAATVSGDTVYAAAGTYGDGSMIPGEEIDAALRSRAVLRGGVTLVSEAGPDETIIVGASATAAGSADEFGRGTDAMRCVFMHAGSKLEGFTLRGGRTDRIPEGESFTGDYTVLSDWYGGAVAGEDPESAEATGSTRVENCVISNCCAVVGGAGKGVTFDGCRIFRCRALRGSAVEECGIVNTVVDDMDSEGSSGICVNNTYACVNVTIGENIRQDDGKTANSYFRQWDRDYGITNCLFLGVVHEKLVTAVNSRFTRYDVDETTMTGCLRITPAEAALGADYRPDRLTSVLVDAGVAVSGWRDTDAYGTQRVYNGAVDIGAVEADWRERYAECLGGKGISVVAADPDVVENDDGEVEISDGRLVVDWMNRASPRETKFIGGVEVQGAGELTLCADGGAALEYDAASGPSRFLLGTAGNNMTLTFTYVPDEDAAGSAVLSGFRRLAGTVLVVR